MARATKGGQTGMNGEWYEGGQFLPNTELGKLPKKVKVKGTGKQQVEPYKWEVAPEGSTELTRSIYAYMAGRFIDAGHFRRTGEMKVSCSEQTMDAYKVNSFFLAVLADKYNKGARWFEIKKTW
jgi:hypothetical protein